MILTSSSCIRERALSQTLSAIVKASIKQISMKKYVSTLLFLTIGLFVLGYFIVNTSKKRPVATPVATYQTGGSASTQDGPTTFTITNIDCSKTELENNVQKFSSTGQLCLVGASIKNGTDSTLLLSPLDQYVQVGNGTKIPISVEGQYYIQNNDWYKELAFDQTVSGVFVFEIPKDQSITHVEFHQSSGSKGAVIAVK